MVLVTGCGGRFALVVPVFPLSVFGTSVGVMQLGNMNSFTCSLCDGVFAETCLPRLAANFGCINGCGATGLLRMTIPVNTWKYYTLKIYAAARSSLEKRSLEMLTASGQLLPALTAEEQKLMQLGPAEWINSTMSTPIAPIPVIRVDRQPAYGERVPAIGQRVLFRSTFGGDEEEYQVAYLPEPEGAPVDTAWGMDPGEGTARMVGEMNGTPCEHVAMPPRDRLLLSNVTAMFDMTCVTHTTQSHDMKVYKDRLAALTFPSWVRGNKSVRMLIELAQIYMRAVGVDHSIVPVDAVTRDPLLMRNMPCELLYLARSSCLRT